MSDGLDDGFDNMVHNTFCQCLHDYSDGTATCQNCLLPINPGVPEMVEKLMTVKREDLEEINHPSYYNQSKIEVIDAIEEWQLGFHLGNAVKYIARAKHKGTEVKDIQKAIWYLQRFIGENKKDADKRT